MRLNRVAVNQNRNAPRLMITGEATHSPTRTANSMIPRKLQRGVTSSMSGMRHGEKRRARKKRRLRGISCAEEAERFLSRAS